MSQPSTRPALYKGYRFPPEIISHGMWLYYRFRLNLRDVVRCEKAAEARRIGAVDSVPAISAE